MGNKKGITQEVKLIQSQNEIRQKQLEIEKKNLEILQLQEKLATQLRYRFCAHSENADEQLVKAYKRRKCGRILNGSRLYLHRFM